MGVSLLLLFKAHMVSNAETVVREFDPVAHDLDEKFRLTGLADLKG